MINHEQIMAWFKLLSKMHLIVLEIEFHPRLLQFKSRLKLLRGGNSIRHLSVVLHKSHKYLISLSLHRKSKQTQSILELMNFFLSLFFDAL